MRTTQEKLPTGGGSGGTPGGSDTQIQFNDSGSFGGAKIEYTEPTATSLKLRVKDQATTDTQGYDLTIQGGIGDGDAEPGAVNLLGAQSYNPSGNYRYGDVNITGGGNGTEDQGVEGGRVNITGGTGGTAEGDGGKVYIRGGSPNADGGSGGAINILGDNAIGSGRVGGAINITAGDSNGAQGRAVTISGGDATSGDNEGGYVNMNGGNGSGSSAGGGVQFFGGQGGETGNGGFAGLFAGDGGDTSGNGGDILLQAGEGTGGGTDGKFKFEVRRTNIYAILDNHLIDTTDKTFTFPNASGTITIFDANYRIFGDSSNPYLRLSDGVGTQLGYGDTSIILGGSSLGIIVNGSSKASFVTSSLTADRTYTFPNQTATLATVTSGTAVPATTPVALGQIFVDTNAAKVYISTGITNSSDWKILN